MKRPMMLSMGLVALAAALAAANEAATLGSESSVGPGETAQYQLNGSIVFADGFRLDHGRAEFVSGGGSPRPGLLGTTTENGLSAASLRGGLLRLEYRLAEAGPVSVEAFTQGGRLIERWRLRPRAAGAQVTELKMRRSPRTGTVMLRVTAGTFRFARTVAVR